jgi:APA family basic amino acid/polyamine antiporter
MSNLPKKSINYFSATSIVIANMIGTGVFTSLGFQLFDISSPFALLMLWLVGGIIALCGAFVYGELGAAMPRSGGEYQYLSKLYHPLIGFAAGWVSATVGFAAPVALAAMALGKYTCDVFPQFDPSIVAIIVVSAITAIHATQLKGGIGFQNYATSIKVLLILAFIILGVAMPTPQNISFLPTDHSWIDIKSSAFAVSLIYVSYAYSGWNAAAYLSGEIENPKKNLPKSLLTGTFVVMILYILINYVFLRTAPMAEMKGQEDVGYISANYIFGTTGANIMGLVISALLISSISAMVLAGPRVSQAMGEDVEMMGMLAKTTKKGIPMNAILVQSSISIVLILTSSFQKVLTYVGFSLNLFTLLTVAGIFILRMRKADSGETKTYRTWGYPITPIIFILLSAWTLCFVAAHHPKESMMGLATVGTGMLIWLMNRKNTDTAEQN